MSIRIKVMQEGESSWNCNCKGWDLHLTKWILAADRDKITTICLDCGAREVREILNPNPEDICPTCKKRFFDLDNIFSLHLYVGICHECFQKEEDAIEDAYGRSQKDICYGCHMDCEDSDTCSDCLKAKQEDDDYILENFYDFSEKKEEVSLPDDDDCPF